jgi:hypothetical protein
MQRPTMFRSAFSEDIEMMEEFTAVDEWTDDHTASVSILSVLRSIADLKCTGSDGVSCDRHECTDGAPVNGQAVVQGVEVL